MTKRFRFLFLVLFGCSISLSAQESAGIGSASMDANFCLTLNAEEPLHEFYVVDISAFGFATETDAKKTFGMKSNNLITYNVDFANNLVIAHLHLDRTGEPKSLEWWSEYLLSVCELY